MRACIVVDLSLPNVMVVDAKLNREAGELANQLQVSIAGTNDRGEG